METLLRQTTTSKTWLYDGKKQRKPFAEYKETPEAVEVSDQSVDANEMIEKPTKPHRPQMQL